ncbi:MAG: hypothetical protein ACKPER_03400 [Dolichospermum sp.]
MSVTTFQIKVIKHQIQSCLRAIKNGLKSFICRLLILEDKLEKLEKLQSATITIKKEQIKSVKGTNPLYDPSEDRHLTAVEVRGVKALLESGLESGRIGRKNYFVVLKTEKIIRLRIEENQSDSWGRIFIKNHYVLVTLK